MTIADNVACLPFMYACREADLIHVGEDIECISPLRIYRWTFADGSKLEADLQCNLVKAINEKE